MQDTEHIEKVRQAIMRFDELLDIMRMKVEDGEREYKRLFAGLSPEDKQLKEKDQQWKLAAQMVDDTSPLRTAVGRAQFDAREMYRAFEELYNIIVTEYTDE